MTAPCHTRPRPRDGAPALLARRRRPAPVLTAAMRTWLPAVALMLLPAAAGAFGHRGHELIGELAQARLAGSRAGREVQALLGPLTLPQAAVWLDCVRGIDPAQGYRYRPKEPHPECAPFETPAGEAAMADYVRRNDRACAPARGEESCHRQYHYTDVAVQHEAYSGRHAGTSDHDVVGAAAAAIRVLQGGPSPAPFSLRDRAEALRVLAHLVGDLHQPLHVGAVYLDARGRRLDPDRGRFDPTSRTFGGNSLALKFGNLHQQWDGAPGALSAGALARLPAAAAAVPATSGHPSTWPAEWAGETLGEARSAYQGVSFGARRAGFNGAQWPAALPAGYAERQRTITERQLARAGARLAMLLQAIWP